MVFALGSLYSIRYHLIIPPYFSTLDFFLFIPVFPLFFPPLYPFELVVFIIIFFLTRILETIYFFPIL